MESKGKSVLGVISDILLIIIIIVAIVITVMTFTSKNSEIGIGNILGYTPFTIQSDSMNSGLPSGFAEGDLIIGKEVKNTNDLKVGDVVTYTTVIYDKDGHGIRSYNTHRITDIIRDKDGLITAFATKGDAVGMEDNVEVYPDEIIAMQVNSGMNSDGTLKNGFKIKSFGSALDFLQSRTGFMICIIIPLALFFIWQIYKLISMFMAAKAQNIDEEVKKRAIEEYLAEQEKEKQAGNNSEEK